VAPTRLPLLFVGEVGTGKAALARLAHAGAAGADASITTVDCALAGVDGGPAWLQQLKGHLAAGNGSVVLRHVEQLDPATATGLCALIDAADGAVQLLSTTTVAYGSRSEEHTSELQS